MILNGAANMFMSGMRVARGAQKICLHRHGVIRSCNLITSLFTETDCFVGAL
jgi:hypothetical protein